MQKNDHKWFLTKIIHATKDYDMLEHGDHIIVGLSGGKDSIVLLYALTVLQKYKSFNFNLSALHIDLGFGIDFTPVTAYCRQLGVPLHIKRTEIAPIVFDYRRETNPCSLCAKLRRGALVNAALALKGTKIALGHHGDDATETLLLNVIHEGKFATFQPRTNYPDKQIAIIRPLVYLSEKTVQSVAAAKNLPIVSNLCPVNGKTERQQVKALLKLCETEFPAIRNNFLSALQNSNAAQLWKSR